MAFDSIAVGGASTLLENIVEQELVPEPVISSHLNRDHDKASGGDITFDVIDMDFISSQTTYTPVNGQGH